MKKFLGLTAIALTASLAYVAPAQAVTNFTIHDVQGEDLAIDVQLANTTQNILGTDFDGVQVNLDIVGGGNYGNMESVYFHLADESLLSGTFATGPNISIFPGAPLNITGQIDPDGVHDLGGFGNNITGLVTDDNGYFDVGLNVLGFEISSTSFFVASLNGPVTEEMFQTFAFAVHASNVGSSSRWYFRWGTSDLAGIVPGNGLNQIQGGPNNGPNAAIPATPEPATAALGLLSLAGLAAASRRRRNK